MWLDAAVVTYSRSELLRASDIPCALLVLPLFGWAFIRILQRWETNLLKMPSCILIHAEVRRIIAESVKLLRLGNHRMHIHCRCINVLIVFSCVHWYWSTSLGTRPYYWFYTIKHFFFLIYSFILNNNILALWGKWSYAESERENWKCVII